MASGNKGNVMNQFQTKIYKCIIGGFGLLVYFIFVGWTFGVLWTNMGILHLIANSYLRTFHAVGILGMFILSVIMFGEAFDAYITKMIPGFSHDKL